MFVVVSVCLASACKRKKQQNERARNIVCYQQLACTEPSDSDADSIYLDSSHQPHNPGKLGTRLDLKIRHARRSPAYIDDAQQRARASLGMTPNNEQVLARDNAQQRARDNAQQRAAGVPGRARGCTG